VNGEAANEGELVVFEREGGEAAIEAASDATVFVMNGKPIDEPIAGYGPFVMNTQEQIRPGRRGLPERPAGTDSIFDTLR